MGLRLLIYFMFTTAVAIVIGILAALIMQPGAYVFDMGGLPGAEKIVTNSTASNGFTNVPQMIVDLIPDNPLEAMLTGEMLGVVIFTILIGVAITQLKPEHAQQLIHFSEAVQKICMIVI